MKIVVKENQRGFLFKHGVFVRMLEPGRHAVYSVLGHTVEKDQADGMVKLGELNPKLLMRNEDFAANVATIDVPDNHIVLHYVDGKFHKALTVGEYFFWAINQKHDFRLIDISKPEAENVPAEVFNSISILQRLYTQVDVSEGECALL